MTGIVHALDSTGKGSSHCIPYPKQPLSPLCLTLPAECNILHHVSHLQPVNGFQR